MRIIHFCASLQRWNGMVNTALSRMEKWLMAPWEHQMLRLADIVQATCPEEADWIRGYHHDAYVEWRTGVGRPLPVTRHLLERLSRRHRSQSCPTTKIRIIPHPF